MLSDEWGCFIVPTDGFKFDRFSVRLSLLPPLRRTFRFRNELGKTVAYASQSDSRVLQELGIFTDDSMSEPVVWLHLRTPWPGIIDLYDRQGGNKLAALERRPWKAAIAEEWMILDSNDVATGKVVPNSLASAFLHAVLPCFPVLYLFEVRGKAAGRCRQNANVLMPKLTFDFTADPNRILDRRIALAASILILAYATSRDVG